MSLPLVYVRSLFPRSSPVPNREVAKAAVTSVLTTHSSTTVADDAQIVAVVREELKLFAADKTGLADYALESAGGSILSTRCSETYTSRSAMITLLGFPVW